MKAHIPHACTPPSQSINQDLLTTLVTFQLSLEPLSLACPHLPHTTAFAAKELSPQGTTRTQRRGQQVPRQGSPSRPPAPITLNKRHTHKGRAWSHTCFGEGSVQTAILGKGRGAGPDCGLVSNHLRQGPGGGVRTRHSRPARTSAMCNTVQHFRNLTHQNRRAHAIDRG